MSNGKSIRTAASPDLNGQPNVGLFRKNDFEALIWQKGYDVLIEQAIECPCRGKSGSPKPSCNNCLGTGWVFINALKTKAIISSINKQTKYQQWSPELSGIINVTVRDSERFSFMDKVTFITRNSVFSEVRPVIDTGESTFLFCSYRVEEIKNIWMFNSDSNKLVLIDPSLYEIKSSNNLIIELGDIPYSEPFNGVLSVEYEHKVSYNIVDIPHDFRSTFLINNNGKNVEYNMPVQGIARKSHLELGAPTNYSGDNLLYNDTL